MATSGVKIFNLIFFILLSTKLVSSSPVQQQQTDAPATQLKTTNEDFDFGLESRQFFEPDVFGSWSILIERIFKQLIPEGISILQLFDFGIKQFVYLVWDILYQFPLTRPLMKFVYIAVNFMRLITDPITAIINKFIGYFYNVMQLRSDATDFNMLGKSGALNFDLPLQTKDFPVEGVVRQI